MAAEGYNYQLLTGIVKVVKPNNRAVLGVSDGQGGFMWLPTDKIIIAHPNQYTNWQTTIFAINANWKLTWKPEKNWETYKGGYPTNTKPIIQPVPPTFNQPHLIAQVQIQYQQPGQPQLQIPVQQPQIPIQQQQTIQPVQPQIPAKQPLPPQQLPPVIPLQQPLTTPLPINNPMITVSPIAETLVKISLSLDGIHRLLRIYINPPKFTTAEGQTLTEEQVAQEYGEPPEELTKQNVNINKDDLPKLF